MENKKVTRENLARHLVEKELEIVGKTMESTLDDIEWYFNITMTKAQSIELEKYAITLIKKTLKVNSSKAKSIFDWWNLSFGLRIKD